MLLDVLSQDNYVSFNVVLAHRFGLHTAIYLEELININNKAIHSGSLNEDGSFFLLDRDYIVDRTTICIEEQLKLDAALDEAKIITISDTDKNKIKVNTDILLSYITTTDEKIVKDISKIVQTNTKKQTKKDIIILNLKSSVTTTNVELLEAYYDWIESVYAKFGFMAKASVTEAQKEVDKAANHNLDVALSIVRDAAIHGYRDMSYSVNNVMGYSMQYHQNNHSYRLNK